MGPARLDLTQKNGMEIYRGEKPYQVDLTFADYDFTGCTGKSQARDRDGNLLFEFVVTFPEANACRILHPDTEPLTPIRGAKWDLFITYSDGSILPEVGGILDVINRETDRD